ncbi:MAG: hypothetical protein ABGX14_05440, partial [bacterium]
MSQWTGGGFYAGGFDFWMSWCSAMELSKILDIFKEPFEVSGEKVYIIPNIGVSFYPQHGENVLVKADLA